MKKKRTAKKEKPHIRWMLAAAACFILLFCVIWTVHQDRTLELPYLTAQAVVVMDCDSGRFLYEKAADEKKSPASVTKLMTLLLVLDDIKSGTLSWDDTFRVTSEQADTQGSKYGIRPGETWTVRQLVAGTAMSSGCDCVQCLVRLCAEDSDAFVKRMNDKAEELSLTGCRFVNATGIDAAGHYMTARDIALLSRTLLREHPEILEFTAASTLEVDGRSFHNTNGLAGRDPRVLGLKTGTSTIAGCNLVTYAEQDGKGYLIVLLNSKSDQSRFSETKTVLDVLFGEV